MQTDNPFVLKDQGDQAPQRGDMAQALALYDQAIALRPQYAMAHYQRGDVLLRQQKTVAAAGAFWQGYLFSQFRKEMGLMAGSALTMSSLALEACAVFEKIPVEEMDELSLLYFMDALRQEARVREAYALLPRVSQRSHLADLTRGAILLDMGLVNEAVGWLEPLEAADATGHVADRLVAVYLAQSDWTKLKTMLDRAIERVRHTDYYRCVRLEIDILEGKIPEDLSALRTLDRYDIIDAALYLHEKVDDNLQFTGTSYQTFDTLAPKVSSEGLILEFGVRNGHSTHRLAELFPKRTVYGFDSFQGLPEAWHEEAAGSYTTMGRIPKLPANVELVRGWFEDTLPGFVAAHPEPVALMNVDCDIYSATVTIFRELDRQIVPGTIIVFDEYIGNKTWREDEFKAFQEWVSANGIRYRYVTASPYTKQVSVEILERGAST